MTLEELKNSDKLTLYIMGTLSAEETAEVENILLEHPELLTEYDHQQEMMMSYADEFSKAPAPGLKSRVMNAIDEIGHQPVPMTVSKGGTGMFYKIAASVLLLVSVGLTWMLSQKNAKINDLSAKLAANDIRLTESNTRFSSLRETLNTITGESVQTVRLKSTDTSKNVYATLFYDRASKQLLIQHGNLKSRTDGMQYQVWALIDGQPYSAGVFDVTSDQDSLQVITTSLDAQLFAVSIEKRGGAEVPTAERIILISDRI